MSEEGYKCHTEVMPFWKPHTLAKPHEGQIDLRIGDKVVTTVDLPDVPAGTGFVSPTAPK
jgi:hypothetical protein